MITAMFEAIWVFIYLLLAFILGASALLVLFFTFIFIRELRRERKLEKERKKNANL